MTKKVKGEGMDWEEITQTELLDSISAKVQRVMGQQAYEDALSSGVRPMHAFAQEYLSDFMHRVELVDPEDLSSVEEEGKQELFVSMGTNPLGEFKLNSKEIPSKLKVWFCIHKKSNLHVSCSSRTMSPDFEKKFEEFSRAEITTILRLNLYFDNLALEAQERWFARMKANYYGSGKDE